MTVQAAEAKKKLAVVSSSLGLLALGFGSLPGMAAEHGLSPVVAIVPLTALAAAAMVELRRSLLFWQKAHGSDVA